MNLQNPRFVLIAIAMLFFAPLLLAIMMRSSWWGFEPSSFSNLGILVQPPRSLPVGELELQYSRTHTTSELYKQWIMLYPLPLECDEPCQKDVAGLRQIHLAAGRHRSSIAIWLLSSAEVALETQKKLVSLYPEINILIDRDGKSVQVLAAIGQAVGRDQDVWQSGQAFLLDPASNIIMRYTAGFDPNDINQDLDQLLKWSKKE